MNKDEANVDVSNGQLIIGRTHIEVFGVEQPLKGVGSVTTIPLLNKIAKRWNAYAKLLSFLERSEYVFNCAILSTPTGEVRNECTNLNIERLAFIEESKAKAQPTAEKTNEGTR